MTKGETRPHLYRLIYKTISEKLSQEWVGGPLAEKAA